MRILVGFTDDAEAAAALAFAGRLAERDAAHLTVIAATATPVYLAMSAYGAVAWQTSAADLADRLGVAVRALPERIGVTHLQVEGSLSRALEPTLRREPYDLLVLAASAARRRAL